MQIGSKWIAVTFEDGNVLRTSVGGTKGEIRVYYLGQLHEFCGTEEDPGDKMVKAVKVEFLED